jgi:hypothetical protein
MNGKNDKYSLTTVGVAVGVCVAVLVGVFVGEGVNVAVLVLVLVDVFGMTMVVSKELSLLSTMSISPSTNSSFKNMVINPGQAWFSKGPAIV